MVGGSLETGGGDGTTWALPGCSICSEVASDRTQAGGHGALAALGRWSEGPGSGPAFPLQVKAPSLTV